MDKIDAAVRLMNIRQAEQQEKEELKKKYEPEQDREAYAMEFFAISGKYQRMINEVLEQVE